jgi:hypothetical protein
VEFCKSPLTHKSLSETFTNAPNLAAPKTPGRTVTHLVTLIVLITLALTLAPVPASASSNGISGFSGKSGSTCTSCHSGSTTSVPTITLTGPTSVTSGSTNSYTLSVNVLTSGNGGLDVAASAGTFAAGTGTQVMNGEITHLSPSTTHSWTFTWTAPTVTTTTSVTLYAAAIDSFSGGTGKLQQAITVTAPVAPSINVSPANLSFSFQMGGATPAAQTVAVSSSGTAFSYSISSSAAWLSATPASGNTPGNVSVSVNPSGLAAGTYSGNVTITASGTSNSPKTVPVTLTVTAATPSISASPASLSFSFQTGGATPAPQTLTVSSSGTAFTYSIATSASWLMASPSSGTTPGSVSVSVNPSGLAAGTYNGNVSITASGTSNSPKTVPVTLTVTTATAPTIGLSPANLSFNFTTGGATPSSQNVSVTGSSAVGFTVASSAAWLTVTPASGTTPGTLSVGINSSGLAAGTYNGTVTVTAASASNSPQKVGVTLVVSSGNTGNPSLTISPGTVSFTYAQGTTTSGSQNLTVNSSGSALSITATASGGNWLSVSPASGSTPATIKVMANPSGMAAGTYNGSVSIASTGAGNSPQTIPVTLTITSSGGGGSGSGRLRVWPARAVYFEYGSGSNPVSSRTVKVYSSGSPINFTAAAHGGSWLSVTPSGGTTPTNLTVSVDATGMASGRYTGTLSIAATGKSSINLPVVLVVATGDDGGGDDGASGGTGSTGGSEDAIRAWPYAYDPAGSNTVAASWVDGTGAATSSSATTDLLNQGLLLSKTSSASNQAQAGAVIRGAEGTSVTQLGFDLRQGSQCTAKSPRFVVVTTDNVVHKAGCASATQQASPAQGWQRVRINPTNPAQMVPAISPGSKIQSMHLVVDDGPETGSSIAVIDNINVNGKLIGRQ